MDTTYDDQGNIDVNPETGSHECTRHGRTVRRTGEEPTAGGSYFYRCTECGSGAWSGQ